MDPCFDFVSSWVDRQALYQFHNLSFYSVVARLVPPPWNPRFFGWSFFLFLFAMMALSIKICDT
jgi:hypothetical protein